MNQKEQILDISMNLNRIGNWAADDYSKKQRRIMIFLDQTEKYSKSLNLTTLPKPLRNSLNKFLKEFPKLQSEGKLGPKDTLLWAEKMMTWGNILSHRSSLL